MGNKEDYTENPMENVQSHDWNKERLGTTKKVIARPFCKRR